ncbi:hypothetical protein ACFE04_004876 [Oxalis oulophora]
MCNKELIFKLTLNKKNTDEGFEDFGVSKIFELYEKLEMERNELGDNVKENEGLNTRKRRNKVVDDDEIIEIEYNKLKNKIKKKNKKKVGAIQIGQGIWTKVQQMTAFALTSIRGLDLLEKICVLQADTLEFNSRRFHCWEYNI